MAQAILETLLQLMFWALDSWAQKTKWRRRIYLGFCSAILGLIVVGGVAVGLHMVLFAERTSDRLIGAFMLTLLAGLIWLLGVCLSRRRQATGSE